MRLSMTLSLIALLTFTAATVHARPTPAEKCVIKKNKAAAKKISAKLKCHRRAITRGTSVDPVCLQAAEEKFDAAIAKVEGRGGCTKTGDGDAIEGAVDQCVSSVVNIISCNEEGVACSSGTTCCSGQCVNVGGLGPRCCAASGNPCQFARPDLCCSGCCISTGVPGQQVCCQ